MKKFILILSVILFLFFSGCINPPEPIPEPEEITQEKAIEIAEKSDCVKIGTLTEEISFDDNSNTWRIKIKPFEVEPNCNGFCVVWEDETAEVHWKCGGEKQEPVVDDSQFLEQECDAVKKCPEGFECASFPLVGLKCYPKENFPCSFVQCPSRHYCVVAESYPVQVKCSPIENPNQDQCDKRCEEEGFFRGKCIRSGNILVTPDSCLREGGIDITYRGNPIPGCDFESIDEADHCCCFELEPV